MDDQSYWGGSKICKRNTDGDITTNICICELFFISNDKLSPQSDAITILPKQLAKIKLLLGNKNTNNNKLTKSITSINHLNIV